MYFHLAPTHTPLCKRSEVWCAENQAIAGWASQKTHVHYAQNWVWKKLKLADMRPWSPNYVVFCGPETVILKILTLAKHFFRDWLVFLLNKNQRQNDGKNTLFVVQIVPKWLDFHKISAEGFLTRASVFMNARSLKL